MSRPSDDKFRTVDDSIPQALSADAKQLREATTPPEIWPGAAFVSGSRVLWVGERGEPQASYCVLSSGTASLKDCHYEVLRPLQQSSWFDRA